MRSSRMGTRRPHSGHSSSRSEWPSRKKTCGVQSPHISHGSWVGHAQLLIKRSTRFVSRLTAGHPGAAGSG